MGDTARTYRDDGERARHLARQWAKLARQLRVKHTPPGEVAAMLARAADLFTRRGPDWQLHAEHLRSRAAELEETHHG